MSAQSLQPIESLLALVVDAINDGIQVVESGKPPLLEIGVFTNLIGDLIPVLSSILNLPASLSGFAESDAQALVAFVAQRLKVGDAHASAIVNASLQAAQSIYNLVVVIKGLPVS